MAKIEIEFDHSINSSFQVGDDVYYCPNQFHGGFNTVDNENLSSTGIVHIGKCDSINKSTNTIRILINPSLNPAQTTAVTGGIGIGDFVMFSKSNQINLSSILGYYASVELRNNSLGKAELFNVGTSFFESSK